MQIECFFYFFFQFSQLLESTAWPHLFTSSPALTHSEFPEASLSGSLRSREAFVAISSHIALGTISPEGQAFFSHTTNANTVPRSDKVFFADIIVVNIRLNSSLYVYSDICSCASAHSRWTRNKSDYGVHGVMFNNKKNYLPRSMCVALAIKCNEWKVLEGCSKFWCVVILNTLWQHTACQGCKTSSNRLLNIRLLHSYTPWLPYIKSGPTACKDGCSGVCVRDYMARSKLGQCYIFIRGEWVCVWVSINGMQLGSCVTEGGKVQPIIQLKLLMTVTQNHMTDGWTGPSLRF